MGRGHRIRTLPSTWQQRADACVLCNKNSFSLFSMTVPNLSPRNFDHEWSVMGGWVRRHYREMRDTPPLRGLTFRSTAVIMLRTASDSLKVGVGDAICCSPVLEKLAVAHLLPTPQLQLRVKTSPLPPVRSLPTHRSFIEFHFDIFIPSTPDFAVCPFP